MKKEKDAIHKIYSQTKDDPEPEFLTKRNSYLEAIKFCTKKWGTVIITSNDKGKNYVVWKEKKDKVRKVGKIKLI